MPIRCPEFITEREEGIPGRSNDKNYNPKHRPCKQTHGNDFIPLRKFLTNAYDPDDEGGAGLRLGLGEVGFNSITAAMQQAVHVVVFLAGK